MASRITVLPAMVALVAASLLAVPAARGQADDYRVYGDDYQSGDFGRIQYEENGVTIHRAAGDPSVPPEEQGTINSPLFPGDTLFTGYDQRAEVQLVGGSVVRVGRRSEVTFLAMPARSATYTDNTVLQLADGRIQISAQLDGVEEFRIDTSAASVYLLGDGDFRIEVDGGETEVFSRRGVAEVVGDGGSVLVRGGTRTEVYQGGHPNDPWPFNTLVTDSFDRWVEDRDSVYRAYDDRSYEHSGEVYDELPYEVQPYYRELSSQGRWAYEADYGRVWYPYDVAPGWRPYSDGYWSYGPRGYFWVSNERWGWAPYHYGRWAWGAGNGWCWIPGRVFGGAWVAWSWGSLYVGWAPLGYWNRPCYVGNIYYDYYDHHSWNFVHYNHFHHRNYQRYAVDVRHIGDDLRGRAVVTRPPRVSPTQLSKDNFARVAAAREAREDTKARLKPVVRGNRSGSNVKDLEARITRDALEKPAVTTGAGTRARIDRPAQNRRDPAIRQPSRPSVRPQRLKEDTAGRVRQRESSARQPARPQVRPRRTDSSTTNQRRRELYEKMAQPRPTRERPSAGNSQQRSPSRPKATPQRRSSPPPSRPKAAPQRRSSPPPSRPKAAPQRRSSSPRSRPTAAPQRRSGSPPPSRPKAAPQRRSNPSSSASRSGSRSGGSQPKARGGSSSGRRSPSGRSSSGRSGSRSSGKSSGGRKK